MADFKLHVQVELTAANGIKRDSAINTFSFAQTFSGTAAELAGFKQDNIEAFYNDGHLSGDAVSSHLNRTRARTADGVICRWYDVSAHLNGSPAGPPVLVATFDLGANSGTDALPEEVALALSFHGDDTSVPEFGPGTRPRARHRGRVFLGPLLYHVADGGPGTPLRPDVSMITTWQEAGEGLIDDSGGTWCVWSKRNAAMYPVTGGWVDDAFDTIRGRGFDPTFKSVFPIPV